MNNTVTATGMKVTAKADGNLLIDGKPLVVGSTKISHAFDGTKYTMKPVTYDSNLKWATPTNPADVSQSTGSPDAALTALTEAQFVKSTTGTDAVDGYYVDYVVYLASGGAALTNQTLKAMVTFTSDEMYAKATKIAFYVGSAISSASSYVAPTYSDAPTKIIPATLESAGAYTEITSGLTIPSCQTSDNGLYVTMRVYFDGKASGTEETYTVTAATKTTYSSMFVLVNGVYTDASTIGWDANATYYTKESKTVAYINSANFPLNAFDLTVKFQTADAPSVSVTASGTDNATLTAAASNLGSGKSVASYAWYKDGSATAIDGATAATYTATANGKYVCKATLNDSTVLTSNEVTVTLSGSVTFTQVNNTGAFTLVDTNTYDGYTPTYKVYYNSTAAFDTHEVHLTSQYYTTSAGANAGETTYTLNTTTNTTVDPPQYAPGDLKNQYICIRVYNGETLVTASDWIQVVAYLG